MKSIKFTVFEHQSLKIGEVYNGIEFTQNHFDLFENFFSENNFPFYTMIRKGIRFCEYVGIIQIGHVLVEVLPKADNPEYETNDTQNDWRNRLIDMIKSVGIFDIQAPSSSNLKVKNNSILDLYFELFIVECESLLRKGLIKKYRKTEGNLTTLKGNLLFGKNIQHNLTHQERFYVRSTIYDNKNVFNGILFKTIKLLDKINTNNALNSRIGNLLLNFPEQSDLKVTEATFSKLVFNRKTEIYTKPIQIARLLLLNYHPDVRNGKNDVLALMFDMNLLWEKFVCKSLIKHNQNNFQISTQSKKAFWRKEHSTTVRMIPDIVIDKGNGQIVVLDTKWKNIRDFNPNPEDLRQMYTYSKFHGNAITALVYPSVQDQWEKGFFLNETDNNMEDKSCSIIKISSNKNINLWQEQIANILLNFGD